MAPPRTIATGAPAEPAAQHAPSKASLARDVPTEIGLSIRLLMSTGHLGAALLCTMVLEMPKWLVSATSRVD